MSKRHRNRGQTIPKARAEPSKAAEKWFLSVEARETLCVPGYTRLSDNPEVRMAVNWIADRVSSMTIKLMENSEDGDVRIRDELARKIDIEPNPYMTRKTFIAGIVRTLYLEGEGNQVTLPYTKRGLIDRLRPIPASYVSFTDEGEGYYILINGQRFEHSDVLHFVMNPDPDRPFIGTGFRVTLSDVVSNLRQAAATKKGFMADKWKPSVIIRVADFPDMSKEGRRTILDEYMGPTEAGEPWIVPSDVMEVQTIKPLSLNDLALSDSVLLDKKTIAAMLGVPLYAVGAGGFNAEEHNNSIRNVVMNVAQIIQQEMTRKLLISPKRHVVFNPRSLYAYSLKDLSSVGDTLASHGIMDGNEVRDWIGMSPREGLSELKALENFIPLEAIGFQKKLKGGNEDNADSQPAEE